MLILTKNKEKKQEEKCFQCEVNTNNCYVCNLLCDYYSLKVFDCKQRCL